MNEMTETRRRRGRLGLNILVPIILLSVVTILTLTFVLVNQFLDLRSAAVQSQRETARRIATKLDAFLEETDLNVKATADGLAQVSDLATVPESSLVFALRRLLNRNVAVFEATLVTPTGREVATLRRFGTKQTLGSQASEPWMESIRQGQPYLGPVTLSEYQLPITMVMQPILGPRGEVIGGLVAQVDLTTMWTVIADTRIGESGYAYIVDESGYLLVYQRLTELSQRRTLAELIGSSADAVLSRESATYQGVKGVPVIGVSAPMSYKAWTVVVEAPRSEVYAPAYRSSWLAGGALAASIVAMVLAMVIVNRRVIRRLGKLQTGVEALGRGEFDVQLQLTGNDELNTLAVAFKQMAGELRELYAELEHKVVDRTRQLERRAIQLETAADISRATTSVLDPNELVRQAVDLIRDRFGFYYVGLFLLDETKRWAVLRAGTGEPGRQMLEAGHRLQVAGESMVGWCTANAQARIALDVGEEAVRFDNPLLPETRSEMALPLVSRGQVIGALTVQSTEAGAFSNEDIAVLQTMADQLAVTIDNARLFREVRSSLEEAQAIHRHYLREAWESFTPLSEAQLGYRYTQPGVTSPEKAWLPAMTEAVQQEEAITVARGGEGVELAVPITLRGQTIGALGLQREEADGWTADDIAVVQAVAEQIALTLENMRLFEDAQRGARREQIIREITTKMRSSTDLDTILQTTVRELAKVLGTSRTFVQLGADSQSISSKDRGDQSNGHQENR